MNRMAQIPETENLVFDKLPLKDIDQGKEGIEKSPLAFFIPSPMNFPNPKYSPQTQNGMLSFSGMYSSCFNQCINSPGNGNTPFDFSFLMNTKSLQSTFGCDSFSSRFFSSKETQNPEFLYKPEDT